MRSHQIISYHLIAHHMMCVHEITFCYHFYSVQTCLLLLLHNCYISNFAVRSFLPMIYFDLIYHQKIQLSWTLLQLCYFITASADFLQSYLSDCTLVFQHLMAEDCPSLPSK